MYFLQGLPSNAYAGDKSVIDILSALFGALWNGLLRVPVPGLSFSFAEVFIALLTAGLVGLILKTAFQFFGSHLSDGWNSKAPNSGKGNSKGKRSEKPAARKGD